MAHVAFVFCCVIWGSMFIVLERVTHALAPVEIALWRFGGGAAILAAIWWATRRDYRPTWREFAGIVLIALLFTAPPQIILPYLINQGHGHSFFGPMVAPIPLLTILVSIPLLGVLPTPRQLIGVLGGLACVWLIVDDGVDRGMSFTFLALTLSIPASSAISNTVIKWKLAQVPAVPLTTLILATAGIALAPLQFWPAATDALHISGTAEAAMTSLTPLTWFYLFILSVVATGISTAVFVWMILVRGPLFAGMTTYVVPVLSLLWGTVDHELISWQQMAAIAGVLSMVALVQFGVRAPATIEQSAEPVPSLPMPEPIVATSIPQPESQVA